MDFNSVIEQERALSLLRKVAKKDNIPHAFLFAGPEGIGKKLAAVVFAKAINCIASKDRAPCCSCPSCSKVVSSYFFHPDIKLFRDLNEPLYLRRDSTIKSISEGSLFSAGEALSEETIENYICALRLLEEEDLISIKLAGKLAGVKGSGLTDSVYINRDAVFTYDSANRRYYIDPQTMEEICQKLKKQNPAANALFRYMVSGAACFYNDNLKIGESNFSESVRGIISDIYLKPFESRKKIFIIDDAHKMTEEAADCFLKTLEEPPPDSILILVTSKPGSILQTIRSRCEILRFAPLSRGKLKDFLTESVFTSEEDIYRAALFSSGSPACALSFDSTAVTASVNYIMDLFGGNIGEDNFICFPLFQRGILDVADGYDTGRIKIFMEAFLRVARDFIVCKSGISEDIYIDSRQLNKSEKLTNLSVDALDKIFFKACDTLEMLDSNANTELLLENFLIDVKEAL